VNFVGHHGGLLVQTELRRLLPSLWSAQLFVTRGPPPLPCRRCASALAAKMERRLPLAAMLTCCHAKASLVAGHCAWVPRGPGPLCSFSRRGCGVPVGRAPCEYRPLSALCKWATPSPVLTGRRWNQPMWL
jgi:hypothetical protein